MSEPRSGSSAQAEFTVSTIDCENCVRAIRGGLGQVPGVEHTGVDLDTQRVTVDYDPQQTSAEALREHLERLGFTPAEDAAATAPPPRPAPAPARAGSREQGDPALRYTLLAAGVALLALAGYAGYVLYPRFNLPAAEGAALLLLATGAGIASFFSPCSFPLLVTLLGREAGGQGRTASSGGKAFAFAGALAAGAALFLLLLGLVIALGGEALVSGVTFTSTAGRLLRAIVGPLLITLGLIQLGLLPSPFHAVEALSRPLMRAQARSRRNTPVLGFGVLGFAYVLAGFG